MIYIALHMNVVIPWPLISFIFPFPKLLSFIKHYPRYFLPKSYDHFLKITIALPKNAILSLSLSQFPLISTFLLVTQLQWFFLFHRTYNNELPFKSNDHFSVIRGQLIWPFSLFDLVEHSFLLKHFYHLASRTLFTLGSPHRLLFWILLHLTNF